MVPTVERMLRRRARAACTPDPLLRWQTLFPTEPRGRTLGEWISIEEREKELREFAKRADPLT
jgi:hypothetical protein